MPPRWQRACGGWGGGIASNPLGGAGRSGPACADRRGGLRRSRLSAHALSPRASADSSRRLLLTKLPFPLFAVARVGSPRCSTGQNDGRLRIRSADGPRGRGRSPRSSAGPPSRWSIQPGQRAGASRCISTCGAARATADGEAQRCPAQSRDSSKHLSARPPRRRDLARPVGPLGS